MNFKYCRSGVSFHTIHPWLHTMQPFRVLLEQKKFPQTLYRILILKMSTNCFIESAWSKDQAGYGGFALDGVPSTEVYIEVQRENAAPALRTVPLQRISTTFFSLEGLMPKKIQKCCGVKRTYSIPDRNSTLLKIDRKKTTPNYFGNVLDVCVLLCQKVIHRLILFLASPFMGIQVIWLLLYWTNNKRKILVCLNCTALQVPGGVLVPPPPDRKHRWCGVCLGRYRL